MIYNLITQPRSHQTLTCCALWVSLSMCYNSLSALLIFRPAGKKSHFFFGQKKPFCSLFLYNPSVFFSYLLVSKFHVFIISFFIIRNQIFYSLKLLKKKKNSDTINSYALLSFNISIISATNPFHEFILSNFLYLLH